MPLTIQSYYVVSYLILSIGTFALPIEQPVKEAMTSNPTMQLKRLQALRAVMASHPTPLTAYIIPTADAHNSEYISAADARREWLSMFTGSAGTAVVTADRALCWTDGRYYTQFARETDSALWTLMKQSLPETPTMEKWLSTNLAEGSHVGIDPTTMRRVDWTLLKTALTKAKIDLLPISRNLVDEARTSMDDPPPKRRQSPLLALPLQYTGKTAGAKVRELREKMAEKRAAALVITALDEIAYTLNIRGSDIQYNPVLFAYLVIREDALVMFWRDGASGDVNLNDTIAELDGDLTVLPYNEIFNYLENMAKELSSAGKKYVWLSHDSSEAIHVAAAGGENKLIELISEVSPVVLAKYIKNPVELEGFRKCHVRDGLAVIRFFKWFDDEMSRDFPRDITEIEAAERLLEYRKDEDVFMGPSFETIMAAGPNGAIIHYAPNPAGEQTLIKKDQLLLVDSGGHYLDGTTDITRTRIPSCSEPSAFIKETYTRVLKGQIAVATAIFPKGVKGNVLDTLARSSLWAAGLDYAHGTGHGVGHFLHVHEGPAGVSYRPYPDDPGLAAGAVLSNEPGYYKVGEFGIRIEDLVELINITPDMPNVRLLGDFDGRGVLGFNTLTLVPHQIKLMDISLLSAKEIAYINEYHKRILDTMTPIMKERNLLEDLSWLEKECQPIQSA